MEKVIIIRFGEIFLKGKNRDYFESLLIKNIKHSLKDFTYDFRRSQGRYFIENYPSVDEYEILDTVKKVFGVYSVSVAYKVESLYSERFVQIKEKAVCLAKEAVEKGAKTFRVSVKRADKRIPMTSMQISAEIGAAILSNVKLKVDLFNFDTEISIDIREDGYAFVYCGVETAVGGLPVGCSDKGMLLLSGGIDSPIAAYMMAKRGMKLFAVHFSSPPYTSDLAKDKVVTLRNLVSKYCTDIKLFVVPFTEIQLAIHEKCPAEFMITIMRRIMMRIAERLAIQNECGALITGESLGQVASQTLSSINCTNSVVKLPVLRPLIGLDKEEIMDKAKKIGTYETSILPYEDCCTVFLPKNPATRPKLSVIEKAESVLDVESLIENALKNVEIL
ncbi:MAG: tRNA uracil 4-sulfurtransferase ThiI [Christensenellales bacterium]